MGRAGWMQTGSSFAVLSPWLASPCCAWLCHVPSRLCSRHPAFFHRTDSQATRVGHPSSTASMLAVWPQGHTRYLGTISQVISFNESSLSKRMNE